MLYLRDQTEKNPLTIQFKQYEKNAFGFIIKIFCCWG